MFGFARRRSCWQDVDYMALIPAHRLSAVIDPASGQVMVQIPRYTDPIFGRLLQPRLSASKKYLKVSLESRGAFLWRLIDGHRTVADLVWAFEQAHVDDAEDAPKRISMYLHAMYDNKFISYINL